MNCPFNLTIYKLSNRKDNMGLTLFSLLLHTVAQLIDWIDSFSNRWLITDQNVIDFHIMEEINPLFSFLVFACPRNLEVESSFFLWNILSSKLTSQDSSPYIWLVWRQAVSSEAQRSGYIYRRTEIMLFHYEPKRRPLKVKTNKGDFKIAFFIFLQSNVAQWHDCIAL